MERKALLGSLVGQGYTLRAMHKEYGFNYKTVRKYHPTYRAGTKTWVRSENLDKIREAETVIAGMADERAPGSAIAEVVGIGKASLKRHCPDLFWTPEETAEFARMVQQVERMNSFGKREKND